MAKPTPGPFKWDGSDLWHVGVSHADIDDPHSYTGIGSDERLAESEEFQANKRLAQKGPEMFELLEVLITDHYDAEEKLAAAESASALIAYVEGK